MLIKRDDLPLFNEGSHTKLGLSEPLQTNEDTTRDTNRVKRPRPRGKKVLSQKYPANKLRKDLAFKNSVRGVKRLTVE